MSLDFPECAKCGGYDLYGTYKRTGLTLSSRCRCQDTDHDRQMEAEARERAARPLPKPAWDEFPKVTEQVERELRFLVEQQRKRA